MNYRSNSWRLVLMCVGISLAATACFQNIDEEGNPNALSMGLPTETFTPFPTETLVPTETPPYEPTIDPEEVALAQQTLDAQAAQDLLLSDTGGSFATETPAVVVQQDNFSLTATVFVANVTQTFESSITQTANAMGLGATITPFPTATFDTGGGIFATPTTSGVIAPPGTVCIHTVQIGDNLFRMGLTYGVSVNSLAAANGITNIQLIYVGQQVTVPQCGTTGVYPPATAFPTTVGGIGGPNLTPSVPGQAVGTCSQHLIQESQTLFQIALQYGVSVDSIVNANPGVITNPNFITMATTINIPCA